MDRRVWSWARKVSIPFSKAFSKAYTFVSAKTGLAKAAGRRAEDSGLSITAMFLAGRGAGCWAASPLRAWAALFSFLVGVGGAPSMLAGTAFEAANATVKLLPSDCTVYVPTYSRSITTRVT